MISTHSPQQIYIYCCSAAFGLSVFFLMKRVALNVHSISYAASIDPRLCSLFLILPWFILSHWPCRFCISTFSASDCNCYNLVIFLWFWWKKMKWMHADAERASRICVQSTENTTNNQNPTFSFPFLPRAWSTCRWLGEDCTWRYGSHSYILLCEA